MRVCRTTQHNKIPYNTINVLSYVSEGLRDENNLLAGILKDGTWNWSKRFDVTDRVPYYT